MIRVSLKNQEPLEKALKRFKKLCDNEGITKTLKRISHYEKPSERNRRKERERDRAQRKALLRKQKITSKSKKKLGGPLGRGGRGGRGGPPGRRPYGEREERPPEKLPAYLLTPMPTSSGSEYSEPRAPERHDRPERFERRERPERAARPV